MKNPKMPLISIVVPVYKAESCLDELYRRLVVALETITRDFEIVLVEDCGGDRSWQLIEQLSRADSRVKGLQFSRNFGQHYGITAGLDYCNGDWVVVMDCDLQDRPEEIPRLYAKAQAGDDPEATRIARDTVAVLEGTLGRSQQATETALLTLDRKALDDVRDSISTQTAAILRAKPAPLGATDEGTD